MPTVVRYILPVPADRTPPLALGAQRLGEPAYGDFAVDLALAVPAQPAEHVSADRAEQVVAGQPGLELLEVTVPPAPHHFRERRQPRLVLRSGISLRNVAYAYPHSNGAGYRLATEVGAATGPENAGFYGHLIPSGLTLPLALSIIAARAVTQPDLPLSALAEELEEQRLDALDDLSADLRTVFACSRKSLRRVVRSS